MFLLVRSNLKKSRKTSFAFFLLLMATMLLSYTGSQLTEGFRSVAPSFHPADLLIGIVGAVIIRLAVYLKGKNAKKYRKGIEYGSAR